MPQLADLIRPLIIKEPSKWDIRFLMKAAMISSWSKDPSTKVGCVLVRPDKTIASEGYNGLAPQIEDTEARLNDRDVKYAFIDHAEENALDCCRDFSKAGYTMYVYPIHSCTKCFAKLLKQGVTRIVTVAGVHPRVSEKLPMILEIIREANANGHVMTLEFISSDVVQNALKNQAALFQEATLNLTSTDVTEWE
ncbi:deaminase [Ewingella americana]|uniref:CMP/dCMP-type deaminase domain-containing protein n=1 Tax=Ewingella americana TaxID=41202 RepID=A0A502GEF3_9GAMM|nr:deaminase [Ewingella americana]TPG59918.1 hypothetical protein EAH77_15235 [Ewingella americana]